MMKFGLRSIWDDVVKNLCVVMELLLSATEV